MEDKSCHPIANDNANFEVARSLRDIPPAHYLLRIESFSLLSEMMLDSDEQNYESDVFEASGYKWKLSLYPNGDKESKGEGHISLYLVIADTNDLPLGWEVNVNFKLFVFDRIQDKYMTVQDANGKVRRFHAMKTEWGFSQLLPLSTFTEAANGYLIHDTCMFGAEVFVLNYIGRGEFLNIMKEPNDKYTWKIDKFSSLTDEKIYSDVFTLGNRKWLLQLYPKGDSREKDKFLSVFLLLDDSETFPSERKTYAKYKLRIVNQKNSNHAEMADDSETFPSERKTYAKYKLRIVNQKNSNHAEMADTKCFRAQRIGWSYSVFLSLTDLNDATKGFLVNDTLLVEAEVSAVSAVKNLSK